MADPQKYTSAEFILRWLAALQHRIELMDGALGYLEAENKRLKARLDEQARST